MSSSSISINSNNKPAISQENNKTTPYGRGTKNKYSSISNADQQTKKSRTEKPELENLITTLGKLEILEAGDILYGLSTDARTHVAASTIIHLSNKNLTKAELQRKTDPRRGALRYAREQLNISQIDLSKRVRLVTGAEISNSAISKFERGTGVIGSFSLAAINKTLETLRQEKESAK